MPSHFVALGSGAELALKLLSRSLKCTTTAHFLKDTFGIELGFESLESAVDGLAFLHLDSAEIIVCHSCHQFYLGARRLGARVRGVKRGICCFLTNLWAFRAGDTLKNWC